MYSIQDGKRAISRQQFLDDPRLPVDARRIAGGRGRSDNDKVSGSGRPGYLTISA